MNALVRPQQIVEADRGHPLAVLVACYLEHRRQKQINDRFLQSWLSRDGQRPRETADSGQALENDHRQRDLRQQRDADRAVARYEASRAQSRLGDEVTVIVGSTAAAGLMQDHQDNAVLDERGVSRANETLIKDLGKKAEGDDRANQAFMARRGDLAQEAFGFGAVVHRYPSNAHVSTIAEQDVEQRKATVMHESAGLSGVRGRALAVRGKALDRAAAALGDAVQNLAKTRMGGGSDALDALLPGKDTVALHALGLGGMEDIVDAVKLGSDALEKRHRDVPPEVRRLMADASRVAAGGARHAQASRER